MNERTGTVGSLAHYLVPTRFGADTGMMLAMRLLAAAPADLSPNAEAALLGVRDEAETLRTVLKDRIGDATRIRDLDVTLSSAWVGIRERLEAMARCGTEAQQPRAEELLQRVLPRGTSFVQRRSSAVWNTSQSLLERIDDRGWQAEVDELVGPGILDRMRELHAELGRALGVGPDSRGRADPKAVRRQLRVLAQAIANYGRILVGEVDIDDRESLERLYRALAPVDRFRAENFRRRSGGDDELEDGVVDPEAESSEPGDGDASLPSGDDAPTLPPEIIGAPPPTFSSVASDDDDDDDPDDGEEVTAA